MSASKTHCETCGVKFECGDCIAIGSTTQCSTCAGITEYRDDKRDLFDRFTCGFVAIVRYVDGGYRAGIIGSSVTQRHLQETADAAAIDIAQAYGYCGSLSKAICGNAAIYITGRINDPAFSLVYVPEGSI